MNRVWVKLCRGAIQGGRRGKGAGSERNKYPFMSTSQTESLGGLNLLTYVHSMYQTVWGAQRAPQAPSVGARGKVRARGLVRYIASWRVCCISPDCPDVPRGRTSLRSSY
jgi:hypothetical protein